MSSYAEFLRHFDYAPTKVWQIIAGFFALLLFNAAAIAYFESLSFGEALHFSLVTGLAIAVYTLPETAKTRGDGDRI